MNVKTPNLIEHLLHATIPYPQAYKEKTLGICNITGIPSIFSNIDFPIPSAFAFETSHVLSNPQNAILFIKKVELKKLYKVDSSILAGCLLSLLYYHKLIKDSLSSIERNVLLRQVEKGQLIKCCRLLAYCDISNSSHLPKISLMDNILLEDKRLDINEQIRIAYIRWNTIINPPTYASNSGYTYETEDYNGEPVYSMQGARDTLKAAYNAVDNKKLDSTKNKVQKKNRADYIELLKALKDSSNINLPSKLMMILNSLAIKDNLLLFSQDQKEKLCSILEKYETKEADNLVAFLKTLGKTEKLVTVKQQNMLFSPDAFALPVSSLSENRDTRTLAEILASKIGKSKA